MEPLKPGAIADGHDQACHRGKQLGYVAGGDTLPACGDEGLCEVHLLGLEHGTELLWALFKVSSSVRNSMKGMLTEAWMWGLSPVLG